MIDLYAILAVYSFITGAFIASFLNVVIWRVPRGESIVSPPSHCPKCGAAVRWWQNIPVLSWICLRGRCAGCRAPISPRYVLVEMLGGALFLAVFTTFGLTPATPVYWLWISLMIAGSFIDFDHKLLPDFVTDAMAEALPLLDRKLRVVSENTETTDEWLKAAQLAYKSTYGYEWQGDNLLIAREAMLISFIEYFEAKFGKQPLLKSLNYIAYIISWNVWQMDGLKGVVPDSCGDKVEIEQTLFDGPIERVTPCEGCAKDDIRRHNGTYCLIRDWGTRDHKKIRFIDLIK